MPSLKPVAHLLMLFLSLIALTGCDPSYHVAFEVHNESDGPIQIITLFPGAPFQDTSSIASGTELVFFEDSGLGSTTDDFLDRLEILPVEIGIQSRDGVMFKKDENDLSLWNRTYPGRSEGIGRVYLRVRSEDFK